MKNGRNLLSLGLAGLLITTSASAEFTSQTGFVTPEAVKITVMSASLIKSEDSDVEVFNGSYDAEFTRSAKSLVAVPLSSISVPTGRYVGVSIKFKSQWAVKLDGNKYYGTTGGGLTDATTPMYTTVAGSARDTGAISTTSGTAVYQTGLTVPGTTGCTTSCTSKTYFAKPVCIAKLQSSCETGDDYVGDETSTIPDLNIVLDLFHAVQVDSGHLSLAQSNTYPFAMIGQPGVAIHLSSSSSGAYGNASMIFSADKKLQTVTMVSSGTGGQFANGGNYVTATAVPAGETVNAWVARPYDFNTTTGALKFPLGNCPSAQCNSSGLASLDNVVQVAGSTVNFSCASDLTGALGYTYTGANCTNTPATATYKVSRIVDPKNVFGICDSTKTGFVAGSGDGGGGTCVDPAITSANADGYL